MAFDTLWIGTSWKMNKLRAEARAFARKLAASDLAHSDAVQLFVIPPFTAVAAVADDLATVLAAVDSVAEIPKSIRAGATVQRVPG